MLLGPQLVEEARDRRKRRMGQRERIVELSSALAFVLAAGVFAVFVSTDRAIDVPLMAGLVVAYAVVSRVRFEYSDVYVSAEQLVFVVMLMLLPVEYVPLLVCGASFVAVLPDIAGGTWHRQRLIHVASESWFAIGPAAVVAVLAPGIPTLGDAWVYGLAFIAEIAFDLGGALMRERWRTRTPLSEFVTSSLGTVQVDAILSPLAFVVALIAAQEHVVLLAVAPLVWLLRVFSQDREERYTATLELNRAYRGTVMLLADVVEFDDNYTSDHSKSVVELVQSVTEHMGIDQGTRQEIEFAALLHDVGKISIPKEILHKPSALTDEEFELMKTHTVEGQFLLDRVGGLLGRIGEIVRSCHERWDGRGYPDGLVGEAIPLAARIVFVCDAYNAMTTDRCYRPAMTSAAAMRELSENAGSQFDPSVVAVLIEVLQDAEPEGSASEDMRALFSNLALEDKVASTG